MVALKDVPGIQRLIGLCNEKFMIVTRFGGVTLNKAIRNKEILCPEDWIDIAIKTAQAFRGIHSRGIIHNDLKGNNICVKRSSKGGMEVTIIDFGLARKAGTFLSLSDQFSPTGHYAPEFYRKHTGGECSSLSDVFAVGKLLARISKAHEFKTPMVINWIKKSQSTCPTDRSGLNELLRALWIEQKCLKLF